MSFPAAPHRAAHHQKLRLLPLLKQLGPGVAMLPEDRWCYRWCRERAPRRGAQRSAGGSRPPWPDGPGQDDLLSLTCL